MLKLSKSLLHRGLAATLAHGYSDFFPAPPEFAVVKKNWARVGPELAEIDLDTYDGYSQVFCFAPKLSRLNVRKVGLLHPFDLIFYTSLVCALRDGISTARLSPDKVFSYRAEGVPRNRLYADAPSFGEFREAVKSKISEKPDTFVGISDIADFYPRVYQHRLVNALEACSETSERPYIRALEKMLFRLSEGTSYGIPVGPPASRLLGEAVLIDVDSVLMSFGIDFVRFVDDFVIFADTVRLAEYGLRILGETLIQHHGLTLQPTKTRVLPAGEYLEHHLTVHSDKEINRRALLDIFGDDPYGSTSYEDLDDDQKRELDAFNLSGMLSDALTESENVDYREVSFILGRLSALQKPELIPIVLGNLERLYPVAHAVAAFFKKFSSLEEQTHREIADALLAPILNQREAHPSDYYSIWALSVFQDDSKWDHAEQLIRIFRDTSSDAVRRYAALALAAVGKRSEAFALRDHFTSGSSLCRTAMLLATRKLGRDERKHLRQSLRLNDSLEKLCIAE